MHLLMESPANGSYDGAAGKDGSLEGDLPWLCSGVGVKDLNILLNLCDYCIKPS